MMVVLSLSTVTRLARPRSSSWTPSSLMPVSSMMALPPVRIADVFEHRLAAIAEAGSLHRASVQRAAQLVDHQSGQRFAFHFLGDHQQRLAGARDLLEQRQQILHVADLLLVDQDVGIFEHALHAIRDR